MSDIILQSQASVLTSMLQKFMRSINTLSTDDPAMDLPVAQIRVCSVLRDGPRTMSALSRELGISLSAVTQIADRLERGGMVERVNEADDRRVKKLQLTSQGNQVMSARNERRNQRVMKVLEHLPPESRMEILASIKTLLSASIQINQETADIIPVIE